MKLTATAIAKVIGAAAAGAALTIGSYHAGRAAPAEAAPVREAAPAQPTLSAPAITSADIVELRQHLDLRFDAQGARIGALEQGLAGVQGYMKAQQEAALEKAVASSRR